MDAWGLKNCAKAPQWYSDTVTAILVLRGFDANDVIRTAYHRYNLSLGGGLSKLSGKVFRIGHPGWLNEIMVMQALGGVEMAMPAFHLKRGPGPVRRSAITVVMIRLHVWRPNRATHLPCALMILNSCRQPERREASQHCHRNEIDEQWHCGG